MGLKGVFGGRDPADSDGAAQAPRQHRLRGPCKFASCATDSGRPEGREEVGDTFGRWMDCGGKLDNASRSYGPCAPVAGHLLFKELSRSRDGKSLQRKIWDAGLRKGKSLLRVCMRTPKGTPSPKYPTPPT